MKYVFAICIALLLHASLIAADPDAAAYSALQLSGTIDDQRVVEASGLARSHIVDGRLWTMNDGGSTPELFAFGPDGTAHGSVLLNPAKNIDWEDLASFEHDGKAWLLVGDIGDNEAARRHCTLYVLEEPAELHSQELKPHREIRCVYPDGALDAEALAVDAESDSVFILAKRTVPARLYRVSLTTGDDGSTQIAEMVGRIGSLPQPTKLDLERAQASQSWHWQPTAMDFAHDGRMAVILTYRGAYLYDRQPGESWLDALQKPPVPMELGGIALAESIAFGYQDNSLYITVEGRKPALYRSARRP